MEIVRFKDEYADEVSKLVCRNFVEINSKDYSMKDMEALVGVYNADKIKSIASYAHMYVVKDEDKIVGTGSISSFWGSKTESILLTIFTLPEYQGKGVGTLIINTLECDELFLRANRIEIPSSITAVGFYQKMGYQFKDGIRELDEEGHYRMEKFR